MLRINRRTDYAIRVMLALAKRPEGTRISTMEIQNEMQVPRAFLQRIIADLSKKGLLYTFPGPNGGLQMARPGQEITMKDVYEAIEGPLLISECLESPRTCPLDAGCPVHCVWRKIQNQIISEFSNTSLHRLAENALALVA